MKIAPVFHELKFENWCNVKIIDTGQHYKDIMSKVFLNELKIKKPDFSLEETMVLIVNKPLKLWLSMKNFA